MARIQISKNLWAYNFFPFDLAFVSKGKTIDGSNGSILPVKMVNEGPKTLIHGLCLTEFQKLNLVRPGSKI